MNSKKTEQRQNNEVLIVDDNVTNLHLLIEILSSAGYGVRHANSGEEALRLVRAKLPSLILLDVLMPDMDGFEVCRQLKTNPETTEIPVIFISALDDDTWKIKGFELGGVDFVTKPFRKEIVLARVKTHIKLGNVIHELESEKKMLLNEMVERRITEAKLQESEELFRTALYGIGDGVITTDKQGRVKMMNQVAENLTGWTQTEANGKVLEDVFRIINESTGKEVEIPVRRVLREGIVVGLANHTLLIAKDGTELPIADSGAPIRNEKGEIAGVVLVFRDQTEERKAESALKESELKYRYLFDSNPLPMWIVEVETLAFMNVNEAAINHYGYSKEEFLSMTLNGIRPIDEVPSLLNAISYSPGRYGNVGIFKHQKKNGELIFAEIISHLIEYEGRKARLVLSTDVTKRIKSEWELKESEERFRKAISEAPFPIMIHAEDEEVIALSRAWTELSGYSKSDIPTTKEWAKMAYGTEQGSVKSYIDQLYNLDHWVDEGEYVIQTKSGENRIWDFGSSSLGNLSDGRRLVISMAKDVTKRKQAEDILLKFKMGIENSNDAIFITKIDGTIEYVNPSFELIYGIPSAEALGNTPRILKSGLLTQTDYEHFWNTLLAKNAISGEIINKAKDGRLITIEETSSPILDDKGEIMGFISINLDITERKKTEEELRMFRMLIDGSNDAIEVIDPKTGNFLDVNARGCQDLGYSREEFLSLSVFNIDPAIDKPTYEKVVKDLYISNH